MDDFVVSARCCIVLGWIVNPGLETSHTARQGDLECGRLAERHIILATRLRRARRSGGSSSASSKTTMQVSDSANATNSANVSRSRVEFCLLRVTVIRSDRLSYKVYDSAHTINYDVRYLYLSK
jgi:hypothetical protein